MSVIEKSKLESIAPDMLEICQDLIDWLDLNGKGTTQIAEKLKQLIWSLLEAGVRPETDELTPQEKAELVEIDKRTEIQEAEGTGTDDEEFWQQLDDMIANYEPVSKNGKA